MLLTGISLRQPFLTCVYAVLRHDRSTIKDILDRIDRERDNGNDVEDQMNEEEASFVPNGAIFPVDERWALSMGGCEVKP